MMTAKKTGKRVGIMANTAKPDALKLTSRVISWLNRKGIECVVDELTAASLSPARQRKINVSTRQLRNCDVTLAFGGDGFLLHCARELYPCSCAILPVNLGSLGFNAQVRPADTLTALERVLNDELTVQSRIMLKAEVVRSRKTVFESVALNEVLLTKKAPSRLINVAMRVEGRVVTTYRGDGVMISTPTGSTAYNLASGGPVVHPGVNSLIVTPLAAHSLAQRPILLSPEHELELVYRRWKDREEPVVFFDCQVSFDLKNNDIVRISAAPKPLKVLFLNTVTWFKALREKLHWGGN